MQALLRLPRNRCNHLNKTELKKEEYISVTRVSANKPHRPNFPLLIGRALQQNQYTCEVGD